MECPEPCDVDNEHGFLFQDVIVVIQGAGLLFQIGVGIIGCDMSHYLLRLCIVYFVSSFLSGIAVSLLYHNTRPSNLRDARSKKIFPKVVDLFVVQDIIFRAARMSHGGRSLVLMLETVAFGWEDVFQPLIMAIFS